MLKKVHFFSFWWIVGKVKKNVNQASFIQTHITQCYLKSYICLNIIVNDSFFWKNSWAPTCPWPRPFSPPPPLCVEMGFTWTLLGTQNVTPNQILVVLKFRYFEKDTKIWKNIPPCFDVTSNFKTKWDSFSN